MASRTTSKLVKSYVMVFCISFMLLFALLGCRIHKLNYHNAFGVPPLNVCEKYCAPSTKEHCCCQDKKICCGLAEFKELFGRFTGHRSEKRATGTRNWSTGLKKWEKQKENFSGTVADAHMGRR
uniref:Membrane lipoprotein n=1 Tax=Helianthus annuus TaxID=4232 RepID=A0A251RU60_HELAN